MFVDRRAVRWMFAALLGLSASLLPGVSARAEDAAKPTEKKGVAPANTSPRIQLAILLDTSNSMDGLINQARTQIWKIVNTLATAKQNGQSPDLHVALFEYGKSSLPKEQNFLRKIVGFTDDLDKISEELFALTTNGGEEYCGAVIDAATRELAWSAADADLKLIYVCGNEPFTQGGVDPKAACQAAIQKGIIVNTIFCGQDDEGIRTGWKEGAQLADGSYLSINQDQKVAEIATPFDEKLSKLSGEVNRTYVAFGNRRDQDAFKARQVAQDKLAAAASPAAGAERAAFKGSGKYQNTSNDLVDAVNAGRVNLAEIKPDELPEELRKLKPEERKAYLEKKEAERKKIQEEIRTLNEQRNKFLAEERKKAAQSKPDNTLDAALIKSIREQAKKRQFDFEEK